MVGVNHFHVRLVVALPVIVYRMTGSAAWTSITVVVETLPMVLLGLVGAAFMFAAIIATTLTLGACASQQDNAGDGAGGLGGAGGAGANSGAGGAGGKATVNGTSAIAQGGNGGNGANLSILYSPLE